MNIVLLRTKDKQIYNCDTSALIADSEILTEIRDSNDNDIIVDINLTMSDINIVIQFYDEELIRFFELWQKAFMKLREDQKVRLFEISEYLRCSELQHRILLCMRSAIIRQPYLCNYSVDEIDKAEQIFAAQFEEDFNDKVKLILDQD